MDNKEAKSATEIKFLNAVASNNFFTALIALHQISVKKDTKCMGKNSVLVILQKKYKISEEQWIIYQKQNWIFSSCNFQQKIR